MKFVLVGPAFAVVLTSVWAAWRNGCPRQQRGVTSDYGGVSNPRCFFALCAASW